ncbi:MAG: GGDEF domain-containing protein [Myxococcales bacterium]|nr:GGDEF domain-containing protein [Myxococcales bacterium]
MIPPRAEKNDPRWYDLLEWPEHRRLLLLHVNGIAFFAFCALLHPFGGSTLERLPYVSAAGLRLFSIVSAAIAGVWLGIGIASLFEMPRATRYLTFATFQITALGYSFIAYMVGPFTTPILLFYLLFVAGLVLFPVRPVVAALITATLFIVAATILEEIDILPSAPMFVGRKLESGRLSPTWLAIAGGIAALFLFNVMASITYMLQRWRAREERFRQASITDELTGLHSRRHLFDLYEQTFALAQRHRKPLSVVMIDVDHFKAVNDEHGHLVGDSTLRHIANILRHQLRRTDICGRYGGEEFAVVLPETDTEGARTFAERCRVAVAESSLPLSGGRMLAVTLSLGFSSATPALTESSQDLLRRADDAMYLAKRNGRNRVEEA